MNVLITGGGIGGLTAALSCIHHGHDVTVFEQSSELGEVGAGIQIPPNAMKVYTALGLANKLKAVGFRPEALEARMGISGRNIFSVPINEQSVQAWGAPYLHIHRADLINVLSAALPPNTVRLGAAITGYVQDNASVTVSLSDGREVSGDILIGADGIHSAVREQMLGSDVPEFTGNVAWRAVVPADALGEHMPNPTACVWMGKGRHAVTYRLRGGKLINFVGVVERDDWLDERWTAKGNKEEALIDFEGWHPVITDIIKAAERDALYRWALFDRSPLSQWVDGRAVLLGDAAHPMLPFMAQGAAMAAEDAWVLSEEMSCNNNNIKESFQAYESKRLVRTSRVQAQSRVNMKTFHKKSKLSQVATYGPMWLAGNVAPNIIRNRLDWMYAHDVVSASEDIKL